MVLYFVLGTLNPSSIRVIINKETERAAQLEKELDQVLDDLSHYFRSPDRLAAGLSHDQLNKQLCRLKARQTLFKNQVHVQSVVTCRLVEVCFVYN